MSSVILKDIKFEITAEELAKKLNLDEIFFDELSETAVAASEKGFPKAILKEAFVTLKEKPAIYLDSVLFESSLLYDKLKDVHRIIAFVCTCGEEIYSWSQQLSDPVERYWAESACELMLYKMSVYMNEYISENFIKTSKSQMNPGSLATWPISQQLPLFKLLGNVETEIGVRVNESFLMLPIKSTSGIFFSDDTGHVNCMYCSMKNCPNRRAPYSSKSAEQYQEV